MVFATEDIPSNGSFNWATAIQSLKLSTTFPFPFSLFPSPLTATRTSVPSKVLRCPPHTTAQTQMAGFAPKYRWQVHCSACPGMTKGYGGQRLGEIRDNQAMGRQDRRRAVNCSVIHPPRLSRSNEEAYAFLRTAHLRTPAPGG